MRIAIIGAGIGGMSAAHDLVNAGHDVVIYEAASFVGGLAAGFKEPHWDWSMEHYYHHWFKSDQAIHTLMDELGLRDQMEFHRVQTVVYHDQHFHPLDSPIAALRFPGFDFFDMARFGLVTAYLRYIAPWKPLEKYTADQWIRKYYGEKLYTILFEPLLVGKFGPYYKEVNMAWFWARFKVRTPALGTFKGGFQAFSDKFAESLRYRNVQIHLNTPVQKIQPVEGDGVKISLADRDEDYDQCLVTVSPGLFARMAPGLPGDYLNALLDLKHLGAVVVIVSLKQQLSREGYYWFNLPKDAGFPFLALVEHTNFVDKEHFGGEHLVYCGDYLVPEHEYFQLSKEELLDRFLPSFQKINPDFSMEWVNKSWLFRTKYAQPVPEVNHSKNIPSIKTPLPGIYFASMSQVYPWDRGTNFAVKISRQAARLMVSAGAQE